MGAMMAECHPSLAIHGVHQDGDGQSHVRELAHLFLIALVHPHQVEDIDDQVAGNNSHVPGQGAGNVQAHDDAPDALDAAQIGQHEHAGDADAGGR